VAQEKAQASGSEETTSATEKKTLVEYVEYSGPASRREITVDQWSAIGIKVDKDSNWMFGNGFRLPVADFPPEAVKYLLGERRSDNRSSFRLVTE
jgi:hypothetical protein